MYIHGKSNSSLVIRIQTLPRFWHIFPRALAAQHHLLQPLEIRSSQASNWIPSRGRIPTRPWHHSCPRNHLPVLQICTCTTQSYSFRDISKPSFLSSKRIEQWVDESKLGFPSAETCVVEQGDDSGPDWGCGGSTA